MTDMKAYYAAHRAESLERNRLWRINNRAAYNKRMRRVMKERRAAQWVAGLFAQRRAEP